mgnify:CR=1 FL=1
MNAKINFQEILHLTNKVLNVPDDAITGRSRESQNVIPRAVCCMIARNQEGIKHSTIAKAIKKNRATVYYYETKHDIYMKVWGAYRRSYNKVKKEYYYINNGKDVFKSYKEFKKHLEKHNIADSPSDDMIFHLYCGKVYITINTSYLKFSNIFEQIKFALKDYKFKYNIEAKNE